MCTNLKTILILSHSFWLDWIGSTNPDSDWITHIYHFDSIRAEFMNDTKISHSSFTQCIQMDTKWECFELEPNSRNPIQSNPILALITYSSIRFRAHTLAIVYITCILDTKSRISYRGSENEKVKTIEDTLYSFCCIEVYADLH